MSTPSPIWLRFAPRFIQRRLEGHSSLIAIIHNTGWLLGDKVLRLGMGLIVGAWVARYLGPAQYGELAYVLAYVAFFQAISELGLNGIAIRDMARDRHASPLILGTVFRLRLIAGLLCWAIAVGSIGIIRPGDMPTLILTAIISGSLVFQAADTVDLWFQSQTQSRRTVVAKAISYLISNLIRINFILIKAPLIYFAITGVIEFVLSAIALYYSYLRFPAPLSWKWDFQRGYEIITESWPYTLSGLAVMIYMRIDQIMLREMLGVRELGIFTAAIPLSTSWYFISTMISQSSGPSIAKKKEIDPAGYVQSIANLFSIAWWIMLPLSIVIALLSSQIIYVLYGVAYSRSSDVLAVHVFANIPVSLGVMQGIWILNEKRNILWLTKTVIGAITNIGINYILIPKYGALGSAYATLIAQSVSAVLSNAILAPEIFKSQMLSWLSFKSLFSR